MEDCPCVSTWHAKHNFCFFPHSLTFPSSKYLTCIHVLQKKSRQASQVTFFSNDQIQVFQYSQNEICTIKKALPLIKLERHMDK